MIIGRDGKNQLDGGPATTGRSVTATFRPPAGRLGLAAAAALLSAAPVATTAAAPDIPGNNATSARLPVRTEATRGDFRTDRDSDWYKVELVGGQDYAVYFYSDAARTHAKLNLRDPSGRVVRRISADPHTDEGFEFRAQRSGTYFVEALAGMLEPFPCCPDRPLGYALAVAKDCSDDATTQCSLRPGSPQRRATMSHADWDRYRATLDARRTYTFRVAGVPDVGEVSMQLIDATGRVLESRAFAPTSEEIAAFTPYRTGAHFLRVFYGNEDTGGSYSVSVTID